MSIAETRREQMFPCLTDAQIAAAGRFAPDGPSDVAPNDVLFGLGTHETAAWLVIEGGIELVRLQPFGNEVSIASLGRGQLSGEIGQLSGAPCWRLAGLGPQDTRHSASIRRTCVRWSSAVRRSGLCCK